MKRNYPPHGGNLLWAAERYGLMPEDFLDFSSNVNPLGPPASALEAAREALSRIALYPEPAAVSLRNELAAYLEIDPGTVMLGNGSTELIHHLVRCLAPHRVTIVDPAFGEYERSASFAAAETVHYQLHPEDGFAMDPRELAEAAASSDITFACNPASPTGRLYRREELLPALQSCRERGGLLAMDESFMGFCSPRDVEGATLLPEIGGGGLVVISTLTKLFALAGLRGPGWLASSNGLTSRLEEKAVPWRVNVVADAAARASLGDQDYLERTRESLGEWKEDLHRSLTSLGIFHIYPSRVNYLLLKITDESLDLAILVDALGRRGVLVRVCDNFRGLESGFIRVAVRTPPDNDRLIAALEEVVTGIQPPK
jgi:threonine-phosphate decarboxylase